MTPVRGLYCRVAGCGMAGVASHILGRSNARAGGTAHNHSAPELNFAVPTSRLCAQRPSECCTVLSCPARLSSYILRQSKN